MTTLLKFTGEVALKLRDEHNILLSRINSELVDRLVREMYLRSDDAAECVTLLASIHQRIGAKLEVVNDPQHHFLRG